MCKLRSFVAQSAPPDDNDFLITNEFGKGLVAGGEGFHVAPGVDGGIVYADFVMNVGTGGATADAGVADDFTATDVGAGHNGKRRKVRVEGGDAETVLDDHEASVARVSFSGGNDAVGSYVDRLAIFGTDVNASVERTLTRKRIQTLAETICDVAHDGPDGRSVIGIGEGHRGQQAEA